MENSNIENRLQALEYLLVQQDKKINELLKAVKNVYSIEEYAGLKGLKTLSELRVSSIEEEALELSKKEGFEVLFDGEQNIFSEYILEQVLEA